MMMNAKSKILVKDVEGVIEMNTIFAKMMQNPLSDEYALLQKIRTENPGLAVRRRQIKSNPKKDTYKGLTYEWMRNHIATHEAEDVVDDKLKAFDEKVYISKCHGQGLRYPTIKKWFLEEYPDVAKFGTIEVAEDAQAEETKVESAQVEEECGEKKDNVLPICPDQDEVDKIGA